MIAARSVSALLLCSVVVLGCRDRKRLAPDGASKSEEQASVDSLVAKGRELCRSKDCLSCHSLDGKKSDGPTFKGMYSVKQNVPVKGFPACPCVDEGSLTEAEAAVVIRYIKSVR